MAYQHTGRRRTFTVDGAPTTPVGANLIVIVSTVNQGAVALSTANAQPFAGVTGEPSDSDGNVAVQIDDICQIIAGATITAGQQVASNAIGQAVPIVPNTTGAIVAQVVGTAVTNATSGNLVDVLINPELTRL
ncbi:MAG TPA: hypothetical protein VN519_06755 [Bryobacteraceae bacterium]|nr:hypothetical protein [Bryobacteraceae bacterium]